MHEVEIASWIIRNFKMRCEVPRNFSAIRLPRAIPKRNVAKISANEFSVVPIGNSKIRVHNISLAREAIPEYVNIKIRSNDNFRSGAELLSG